MEVKIQKQRLTQEILQLSVCVCECVLGNETMTAHEKNAYIFI